MSNDFELFSEHFENKSFLDSVDLVQTHLKKKFGHVSKFIDEFACKLEDVRKKCKVVSVQLARAVGSDNELKINFRICFFDYTISVYFGSASYTCVRTKRHHIVVAETLDHYLRGDITDIEVGLWHEKFRFSKGDGFAQNTMVIPYVPVPDFLKWLCVLEGHECIPIGFFLKMPGKCEILDKIDYMPLNLNRIQCDSCLTRALQGLELAQLFMIPYDIQCPHGVFIAQP